MAWLDDLQAGKQQRLGLIDADQMHGNSFFALQAQTLAPGFFVFDNWNATSRPTLDGHCPTALFDKRINHAGIVAGVNGYGFRRPFFNLGSEPAPGIRVGSVAWHDDMVHRPPFFACVPVKDRAFDTVFLHVSPCRPR